MPKNSTINFVLLLEGQIPGADMRRWDEKNLILVYIYLASSVVLLGIGITFGLLLVCWRLGVDISRNYWLLSIPPASSLILNVFFIELYRKIAKR
jgi:hypothetical protein